MTTTLLLLAALAAGDTTESRPEIFCEYFSRDSRIDTARVKMELDGEDVTAKAQIGPTRISYVPDHDLAPGRHAVKVTLVDVRGRVRTQRWAFTVDPEAKDETPPTVSFVDPTPANGSVMSGPATVRVELDEPGTIRIFVARDGGGFRDHTAEATTGERHLELALDDLEEGATSIRVEAQDDAGNRAPHAFTAFGVDRSAPELESVTVTPSPVAAGGTVRIEAKVDDAPFQEIRELSVTFQAGGAGPVTVTGRPPLTWTVRDRKGDPLGEGAYAWTARVTDWAGHESNAVSGRLVVKEKEELRVTLDPLRRRTAAASVRVVARARAGAEVELTVNDRPAGRAFAAGSGRVTFGQVALDAGVNRIRATARDLASGDLARSRELRVTRSAAPGGLPAPPTGGKGDDDDDDDQGEDD